MKTFKKNMPLFMICAAVTLCSCSASEEPAYTASFSETYLSEKEPASSSEITLSEEEADMSRAEVMADFYQALEDAETDEEKIKQVNGEELKSVDFTDCSVAALDSYGVKIYERLSEEGVKEFTDCIAGAKISAEEYGELPDRNGGSTSSFQITLSTGEQIYIGMTHTEDADIIIINDIHGFRCDKEGLDRLRELYREIYMRFIERIEDGRIAEK